MPVMRDIRLLEKCNHDKSTLETVKEIVLPRMLRRRKECLEVARILEPFDQAEYELASTEAARIRFAVSRFIRRYRAAKESRNERRFTDTPDC